MQDTVVMIIAGHSASVTCDDETGEFRGKFLDVNGYCDFVAGSIDALRNEGAVSPAEFVATCTEEGIEPFQTRC